MEIIMSVSMVLNAGWEEGWLLVHDYQEPVRVRSQIFKVHVLFTSRRLLGLGLKGEGGWGVGRGSLFIQKTDVFKVF
jgi:hypothetical protein